MVYHIVMLVLVFIAVMIMTGGGYGVGSFRNPNWNIADHYKTMLQTSRAYNVSFVDLLLCFKITTMAIYRKMHTNIWIPQLHQYCVIKR